MITLSLSICDSSYCLMSLSLPLIGRSVTFIVPCILQQPHTAATIYTALCISLAKGLGVTRRKSYTCHIGIFSESCFPNLVLQLYSSRHFSLLVFSLSHSLSCIILQNFNFLSPLTELLLLVHSYQMISSH